MFAVRFRSRNAKFPLNSYELRAGRGWEIMFEWESRNIDGHVVSERYMCECMLASLCCACCNAECIGMGVLFVYTCWVCMSQLNCLCCVVVGGCFGLHPRSPPLSIRAFHPLSTHSSSTLHPLFIHSPPPFPLFIRSPSAVVACVPVRPGVQLQCHVIVV